MAKFIDRFQRIVTEAGYVWTPPYLSYPTDIDSEWLEWKGEGRALAVEEWGNGEIEYLLLSQGGEDWGKNPSEDRLADIWEWLHS